MTYSSPYASLCKNLNWFRGASSYSLESGLEYVTENKITCLSFERPQQTCYSPAPESVVFELGVVSVRMSLGLCHAVQPS